MTKLKIHLLLPLRKKRTIVTKRVQCEGVVIRTEAAPGGDCFHSAVFFREVSPRDASVLSEFVDALIKEKING